MFWLDSDVQCLKTFDKDPMQVMVENDLVILFYNFPFGVFKNNLVKPKMKNAYNKVICGIDYDGHLKPHICRNPDEKVFLRQIHGYHHITSKLTKKTVFSSLFSIKR